MESIDWHSMNKYFFKRAGKRFAHEMHYVYCRKGTMGLAVTSVPELGIV